MIQLRELVQDIKAGNGDAIWVLVFAVFTIVTSIPAVLAILSLILRAAKG